MIERGNGRFGAGTTAGRCALDPRHARDLRVGARPDRLDRGRDVLADDLLVPGRLCELAIEGGCNAVATTLGVLGAVSRKFVDKIPFVLKLNHNELFSYPNTYDQTAFGNVQQAFDMGCIGVGATIYWGSDESRRQLQEVSQIFEQAHELGMFTVLWCYTRNEGFKTADVDYHVAADLTGQANHLGVTIEADIIKQKQPESNGGFKALNTGNSSYGKLDERIYTELTTDHPIDLTRYQVANCFMGRAGLINSGGGSGKNDLEQAVRTAVINKRAGGMGLISGRKAFQRPMKEGIGLLNAIQRPQATVFGKDAYATIQEKAAAFVFAILQNGPFRGGNRRLAAASLFHGTSGGPPSVSGDFAPSRRWRLGPPSRSSSRT